MIEPRERFRKSPFGRTWLDVVDGHQFQEAAQAALLHLQVRLASPPDHATAAAHHYRMEGARQFLGVLMGLTEPEAEAPQRSPENLNHNTRK